MFRRLPLLDSPHPQQRNDPCPFHILYGVPIPKAHFKEFASWDHLIPPNVLVKLPAEKKPLDKYLFTE